MRRIMTTALLAAALLGSTSVDNPLMALAMDHDGNWSVLVITEKGDCDKAYRYSVSVHDGHVRYRGDAAGANLAGTVTPTGEVSVSIRLRDRGADGTGRLSDTVGVGRWHGNGPNGTTCAGRWEADRH